ncbi:MAG TPA: YncE family protein, partial [Terriglobales bacterium]|nr:YncE family protein [Terriglobales bacterium]
MISPATRLLKSLALALFVCIIGPTLGLADDPTETPTSTETATPTPTPCASAARYWVGGGGSADDSAHWSCTSGGSGGASVPACVAAGDTFQGSNDCIWDQGSGLVDIPNIFSEGLCCRNADWTGVVPIPPTPPATWTSPAAWFTDGFIVSAGLQMGQGIFYHLGAGPMQMTAGTGTHQVGIVELPAGDGIAGGIDFHGTGTYGDDAVWSLQNTGSIAWGYAARDVILGYGTLQLNGLQTEGWRWQSGHGTDPADSFTIEAGMGPINQGGAIITATRLWAPDSDFVPGNSTIWCGGAWGGSSLEPCTFDGGGQDYLNVAARLFPSDSFEIVSSTNITGRLSVDTDQCQEWLCGSNPPTSPNAALIITAGTTQTVAVWDVRGTAERPIDVRSSQQGQPWTLHCTVFPCVSDHIVLSDSICTGETPCFAGPNSTVDSFSLANGWSTAIPPPPPTPTPQPNDCSAGANMCNFDNRGSCSNCMALHGVEILEGCWQEAACVTGAFNTNGSCSNCPIAARCAATLAEVCAEDCRCLATPTPEVTPTSTPSPAPTVLPSFVEFESGQVRPLALSPDGTRLFAVNTPDNRLEIFDIGSGGELSFADSVPVGLEPVAVAARSDDEVWVVNHLSDSVSIVDLTSTPPRVKRTLLVGDEPRDIVFAGVPKNRAFITTAHRGQNDPADPQLLTEGIGRADVWVFDATNLGSTMAGDPLTKVVLFSDTPRALAATADGAHVYAAAFHSGNRTASVSIGRLFPPLCENPQEQPPDESCFQAENNLPFPHDEEQPATALIVKQRNGNDWLD